MVEWIFKDSFDINPYGYGFIYKITYRKDNEDYTYYGKKSFISETTKPALKTGIVRDNAYRVNKNIKGKRVAYDVIVSESNWRKYNGSAKCIDKTFKIVSKEILHMCLTKQDLSYMEDYTLMVNKVLFDPMNLNYNIAGRYFAEKITGSKKYYK